MNQFKKTNKRNTITKSGKYIVLMLVLLLTIFVAGTAAQDEIPTTDLPDYEVVSVEVGPTSTTTTITVFANKTTYVASDQANQNFAGLTDVRVGREAGLGALRTLIQFDLSMIPNGSYISNAALNINQSGSTPSGDSPYTIQTRFLASDWSEGSITWNSHQPQWGDVIGNTDVNSVNGWKVVHINSMIQEWVNGRPNYGLLLQGSNEASSRSRQFASRYSGNRPFINITYTADTCAPSTNINDLPAWSPATYRVYWSGSDCGSGGQPPSGIKNYDAQSSTDNVNWSDWKMATTDTSGGWNNTINGQNYYFRVRARDNAGNVGPWSTVKSTRVDREVPINATIEAVTILDSGYAFPNFTVNWSATDALSGIQKYLVRVHDASGYYDTEFSAGETSGTFPGGTVGEQYGFEVYATDNAGNVSVWSSRDNVIVVNDPSSVVLPFDPAVVQATSVQVSWLGFASNTITQYDIYYRVAPSTTWINWNSYGAGTTFDTFDATTVIPSYVDETVSVQFQARAKAENSPLEPEGPVEATIVFDPNDNLSNNTIFLPIISNN